MGGPVRETRSYHDAALAMLDSLASPAYLAVGGHSPGILLHGVAFYRTPIKPKGEDIDRSLIYGDYYFVEALVRFKQQSEPGEPAPPDEDKRVGEDAKGCAATPGTAMAAAGMLLGLLRPGRRPRVSRRR
jgi:unsaturated chondroitin disaccharide hydrolase